jgi:hypothetical protein
MCELRNQFLFCGVKIPANLQPANPPYKYTALVHIGTKIILVNEIAFVVKWSYFGTVLRESCLRIRFPFRGKNCQLC